MSRLRPAKIAARSQRLALWAWLGVWLLAGLAGLACGTAETGALPDTVDGFAPPADAAAHDTVPADVGRDAGFDLAPPDATVTDATVTDATVTDTGAVDVTADAAVPDAGVDAPADVPSPDDVASADASPDTAADAGADTADVPACPPADALVPPTATGRLYLDPDRSSSSHYVQRFAPPGDEPLASAVVRLISAAAERATTTCPDGRFAFGALDEGLHVLEVDLPRSVVATSANRAVRFPAAVREGHVRIVTFGDSVPRYGAEPYFPAQLATLLSPLATVEDVNIAVPGAVTTDWLPGASYYERYLVPALADGADVVVLSIGGNDALYFFENVPETEAEAREMVAQLPALLAQIVGNLRAILEAVHALAPEADRVYCLYPNYAVSDEWHRFLGSYAGVVEYMLPNVFRQFRGAASGMGDVLVADMFEATRGLDIDALIVDPLHLSALGGQVYAEQIFIVLGGVRIGASPLGTDRLIGFAPPLSR